MSDSAGASNVDELPLPPAPTGRDEYTAVVETAAACAVVGIEADDPAVKAFAFAQAAAWYAFLSAEWDHTADPPEDDDASA